MSEALHTLKQSRDVPIHDIALWIGPEGDFSIREQEAILATGAQAVSFGENVMRSETATVYGLSVLNYEFLTSGRKGP